MTDTKTGKEFQLASTLAVALIKQVAEGGNNENKLRSLARQLSALELERQTVDDSAFDKTLDLICDCPSLARTLAWVAEAVLDPSSQVFCNAVRYIELVVWRIQKLGRADTFVNDFCDHRGLEALCILLIKPPKCVLIPAQIQLLAIGALTVAIFLPGGKKRLWKAEDFTQTVDKWCAAQVSASGPRPHLAPGLSLARRVIFQAAELAKTSSWFQGTMFFVACIQSFLPSQYKYSVKITRVLLDSLEGQFVQLIAERLRAKEEETVEHALSIIDEILDVQEKTEVDFALTAGSKMFPLFEATCRMVACNRAKFWSRRFLSLWCITVQRFCHPRRSRI